MPFLGSRIFVGLKSVNSWEIQSSKSIEKGNHGPISK
jgi:hypothetical protein